MDEPSPRTPLLHRLWTGSSAAEGVAAERALLSEFVRSPFSLRRVPIEVSSSTEFIATCDINSDAPGVPLVWAHGAGAGIGWGYKIYDKLANLGGIRRRVGAFDWLGQANSSRPRFPSKSPEAALEFFLDSFEAWLTAMAIQEFHLFAHSTGAYVATHYAMSHPGRVQCLVLHGVAGLGSHPTPWSKDDPEYSPRRGPFAPPWTYLWDHGVLNFGML